MFRFALLVLVFPAFALGQAKKDVLPEKVSYYRDVRPIFQQQCQGCHQPAKALGSYVMTNYADLFKKGERDKAGVIAGKPKESYLLEIIKPITSTARMPKNRDPLTDFQIAMIEKWIVQGATDDTPASAKAVEIDADHPPIYRLPPTIPALAFSPDGKLIAIAGYHEVLLRKTDDATLVARLVGLSERVQSLAFSPDGKTLAVSGGDPGRLGEVQLWTLDKHKLRLSIPVTYDTVYGVSWSPDGTKVAVACGDNTVRAFDAADGKQILFNGAHGDWALGTAFSVEGNYLISVSRDRTVKLTEVATQRFIDNVTSITPGALKGGLSALDVRPMATRRNVKQDLETGGTEVVYNEFITAGADGQPRLYKMHRETKRVIGDDANKIREYEKMPGRVYSVMFDKTGKFFAAGSSLDGNGEVRVYEVDTGKKVSTFEKVSTPIYTVAFHPEGKIVASAGFDGLVRLHEAMTGKLIKEFLPVELVK
jgi:WD40 repeat protein